MTDKQRWQMFKETFGDYPDTLLCFNILNTCKSNLSDLNTGFDFGNAFDLIQIDGCVTPQITMHVKCEVLRATACPPRQIKCQSP